MPQIGRGSDILPFSLSVDERSDGFIHRVRDFVEYRVECHLPSRRLLGRKHGVTGRVRTPRGGISQIRPRLPRQIDQDWLSWRRDAERSSDGGFHRAVVATNVPTMLADPRFVFRSMALPEMRAINRRRLVQSLRK